MNHITRSILPGGVVRDAPFLNYENEPCPEFTTAEICMAYKRVRKWQCLGRVRASVGKGAAGSMTWAWNVIFIANTKRSGGIDPVTGLEIPDHSDPLTEVDLTRTYGTDAVQDYNASIFIEVRDASKPGPDFNFDYTTILPLVSGLSLFQDVARQKSGDWKESIYRAQPLFSTSGPTYNNNTIHIDLGVDPAIFNGGGSGIEAEWSMGGLCASKQTFAGAFVADDVFGPGGERVMDLEGSIVLRPYQFWPYGDRDGNLPKFEEATGRTIIYPST